MGVIVSTLSDSNTTEGKCLPGVDCIHMPSRLETLNRVHTYEYASPFQCKQT
jgi:hypothetical protein